MYFSYSVLRNAPTAVLLLVAAAAPALGQAQVVERVVIQPSAEDLAVTGEHASVNFGAAVALSGATAAIGIPHEVEDQSLPGPGRVGIYSKTKAGWIRPGNAAGRSGSGRAAEHDGLAI